jgi:hypothetical protein
MRGPAGTRAGAGFRKGLADGSLRSCLSGDSRFGSIAGAEERGEIIIADFEEDSYGGWEVTATAFGSRPRPAEEDRSTLPRFDAAPGRIPGLRPESALALGTYHLSPDKKKVDFFLARRSGDGHNRPTNFDEHL